MLKGKNRVRLVFQGVAALAENVMDGPLGAPKAGALPAALHPEMSHAAYYSRAAA